MKLTPTQRNLRALSLNTMRIAHAGLCTAIADYNESVRTATQALDLAKDGYNEAIMAAAQTMIDMGNELHETIEGRSDRWRESDAGIAAGEWADTYSELECEEFEFEELFEVVAPDCVAEEFEAASSEESEAVAS